MIEMIDNHPGELFNGSSSIYCEFWQAYVDLEGILLPDELSMPYIDEYGLTDTKEDYSEWYKKKYKEFCEKIRDVRAILGEYISE